MTRNEQDAPRILVTGGGGFLGSEIVRQVNAAGIQVRAADRRNTLSIPGIDHCRADILDPGSLSPALNGIDCVIHAAGLAHIFRPSAQANVALWKVNVEGTENVIRTAADACVRDFVLVSSVAVYGLHTPDAVTEESECHPVGAYAQSKYEAEQRARRVAEQTGMRLTILRMATIYGEGDPGNILRLICTIDRGRFIWVGDGANRKSFIYRGDAARACVAAWQQKDHPGIQVYNVTAPPCAMREVVEIIASALGRRLPGWCIPPGLVGVLVRLGEVAGTRGRLGALSNLAQKWLADDVYDATRIQNDLGFSTLTSLEEGLHREVEWYRSKDKSDVDRRLFARRLTSIPRMLR